MNYRFLFHLLPYSGVPSNTPYQHTSIALAEGFLQTHQPFYATCKYWFDQERKCLLFEEAPKEYRANVHIYSTDYVMHRNPALTKSAVNVLLDDADGWQTAAVMTQFADFDLILRSHYTASLQYLPNVRPWAFGLTNRLIHYNEKCRSLEVQPRIYAAMRVAQNIRTLANDCLLPLLEKKYAIYSEVTDSLSIQQVDELPENDYWNQTGRRHNEKYYHLLNASLLTFAFGGISEYKPIQNRRNALRKSAARILAKVSKTLHWPQKPFYGIYNFDNWRFWEALVSNTCPVALDFAYWNCHYPEIPIAGVHYIGVKDFDFAATARQILSMSEEEINVIAENGRNWVHTHYSPLATAKRFIALLDEISSNSQQ